MSAPTPFPAQTLALAGDHGGVELKAALAAWASERGLKVLDLGTEGPESVDYPVFADRLAEALAEGRAEAGVLVCGTGIGISIAANRHRHVRAALIHDALGARLCREHNDANVICFGGRTTGVETARDCLKVFLETAFEGGRHTRRVAMFSD
ncbi:ribose 5-phosphate isomerase B [Roseospirillum parvum]|uniref:Ribose 5-phosphate isomerase B n=1 Tax=Roseospirillum parvum TaxID=83401 RepID=A0A1G7Y573_9PROT|nr:ribose 5-phosphate isomerase B [Roseospirillum parvum]SDG91529.1 ribose 5-phosphate isomerase B [Roseospirillum parvum]